jgi:hypothetical protein
MQLALLTSTPESDPLITQFCTLDAIQDEGTTPATRFDLDRLDENTATAVDCSLAATCRGAEGSAPADAAGYCGGEKEERSDP